MLVINHEYILVFSKKEFRFLGNARDTSGFKNTDNDSRGLWRNTNMKSTISKNKYIITDPKTKYEYEDT
jgi:adenine-specific DNA-methyltransferase